MEKKIYEEPSVQLVEFDFNECIAASDEAEFAGYGDLCFGGNADGCEEG